MHYYIGTDKSYIAINKNGKAISTNNFKQVKLFTTRQKAEQFLVSLPRKLYNISSKWEVKEIVQQEKEKSMTKVQCPEESTAIIDISDISELNYLTILDSVAILKVNEQNCITQLNSKLSNISQEIVDIEHYIEFSNLNASEAYKAYKMLRDTLQERRKIKDNISAAQSLYENCNVDNLFSCNEHLHNRVYKPRKLISLFQ